MKRQVCYLMSGCAHLPYLVVSLHTLRRHWKGDVAVYAWPESWPLALRIGEDLRLNLTDVRRREAEYSRRNSQFFDKIALFQTFPEDTVSLYLDADTTVHSDINPLFDAAEQYGFCATQFNSWTTAGRIIGGRVRSLLEFPEIDPQAIRDTVEYEWPSVNGGVWACKSSSPVLPLWLRWSLAANATFIPDEKVLHVMQPLFVPRRQMTVLCEDGRYNSSTHNQSPHLPDDRVVIYHGHGDSFVRPQKSPRGYAMWWPLYQECLEQNIGGIADWRKDIQNKWMDKLE